MTKIPHTSTQSQGSAAPQPTTLATVLAALNRNESLSPTRRRDLRSSVSRVAGLLGNSPSDIPLDLRAIAAKLATVSPIAAGMTVKRMANIRSDFLAAVKVSGTAPTKVVKRTLSPPWADLFTRLSGRRAHLGLSRLARYASAQGIEPKDISDEVVAGFIAAVRQSSLHRKPNGLHRQVTLIWNEAARDPALGLSPVTVASFRGPPKRIDLALLPPAFRQEVDDYFSWCGGADPFAADARSRSLASRTLRLRRDQIHAAVSSLVDSGTAPRAIESLADLVNPKNFTRILRRRLEHAGGAENTFNYALGKALIQIAREWVRADAPILTELKRLFSKLPTPVFGLTDKNKSFIRQFDDPKALQRLVGLPERLWAEVRRDNSPSFRTLAKAQAALAVGILTYIPLRLQNLADLSFDTHLFIRAGAGATSTLELSAGEVKNGMALAFDIPRHLARMLIEYRERIAPKIIGPRPMRLFVNVDGTPKSKATVAWLIASYLKRRAGIVMTPHQFRHLAAKVCLEAEPGSFELVKQVLGHKNLKTTMVYAGIDGRRAARHHQRLVARAIAAGKTSRARTKSTAKRSRRKRT